MRGIAPERLVFLHERGVLTGIARLHGRSPRWTRASREVPHGFWTPLSVLRALGRQRMLAAMSVQAATDGAVFRAYLERVLLPELRRTKPDAVLVLDNRRPQDTEGARAAGPLRFPLPLPAVLLAGPEPDRAGLRAGQGRAAPGGGARRDALQRPLGLVLDRISAANATAYFRHCGYNVPTNPRS